MAVQRAYSWLDKVCLQVDQMVRTLADNPHTSNRPYPAAGVFEEIPLTENEQKHAAGLMRINHAGEICAQALYQGQAIVTKDKQMRATMQQAAFEEGDHLSWCHQRLTELNSHTSYLKPVWYFGSLLIGMSAGIVGDKWSLGFLAETERQVIKHLDGHLQRLPQEDVRSRAILQQMEIDETKHHDTAIQAGAHSLPRWIRSGMRMTAKIMVKSAYWV
jgi:3-demethoxyubiquinol 3-hydroxylase